MLPKKCAEAAKGTSKDALAPSVERTAGKRKERKYLGGESGSDDLFGACMNFTLTLGWTDHGKDRLSSILCPLVRKLAKIPHSDSSPFVVRSLHYEANKRVGYRGDTHTGNLKK